MTNHSGNVHRVEVLGARSNASFLYMSKGRRLLAYVSRLDPILEGTGFETWLSYLPHHYQEIEAAR